MGEPPISFGPFQLVAAQRLLLEGDKAVRLGSRAFDLLRTLVERAGEVISKEELIARVWPTTLVVEADLRVQVSALRRSLGDGQGAHRYIRTVAGKGYCFIAPIGKEEPPRAAPSGPLSAAAPHNLPFGTTRLIGREETVATVVEQLSSRLLTIVGPGGIGKTSVGLAAAERLTDAFEGGVWMVDLAPLRDPGLVSSVVAAVLGLEVRADDPLPFLVSAFKDSRTLLVLDNCEHVIDAAAELAAAVLRGAPGVTILSTSRQPLGVRGECVHRLGPLGSPGPSPELTATQAAAFPAVRLFVARATAIAQDFALTDANAALISQVCRRLDGLPLAIEFAAARVGWLGIADLAASLDHRLGVLESHLRAPLPRHRTMRAVIDWSYELLSPDEQRFFGALGIFAGGFDGEAAAAVAPDSATAAAHAMDRLVDLEAKSLVVADLSGAKPRFRLLDTARDYTTEKLASSGERIARRHAEYYLKRLNRAEAEAPTRPAAEWLAEYAMEIDNVRSALDWALSPTGDGSLAIALTAGAATLLIRLSLLQECAMRVRRALEASRALGARDPHEEMRLLTALGTASPEPAEAAAAFTKVLGIAEDLDDLEHQLLALRGLNHHRVWTNQFRAALSFAQRFYDLAASRSNQSDLTAGERLLGTAKLVLGDLAGARHHLEQALARPMASDLGPSAIRFDDAIRLHYDGQVAARVFLTDVLWRQGFPEQAVQVAERNLAHAKATGHITSQCLALALGSCPSALWTGDLAAAADYAASLLELSKEHGLSIWAMYGARYRRVIALKGGHISGVQGTDQSDADLRSLTAGLELAEGLLKAERGAEGLEVLAGFAAQSSELGGFTPEFLRLRGELFLLQTTSTNTQTAEHLFTQALDHAQRQGALSWALRAATSLARLLRDQGREVEAVVCLEPVYQRFTEGFRTMDLIAANQLLGELNGVRRAKPLPAY